MGWWSHNVMGGDRPLDLLGSIAKTLGAPFDAKSPTAWHCYEWPTLTPERVTAATVWLDTCRHDRSIAAQVLATLLMARGAPIGDALRHKLSLLIESDEWAAEGDYERRGEIDGLLLALMRYRDGTPADYDNDPGLLAKLAEKGAL